MFLPSATWSVLVYSLLLINISLSPVHAFNPTDYILPPESENPNLDYGRLRVDLVEKAAVVIEVAAGVFSREFKSIPHTAFYIARDSVPSPCINLPKPISNYRVLRFASSDVAFQLYTGKDCNQREIGKLIYRFDPEAWALPGFAESYQVVSDLRSNKTPLPNSSDTPIMFTAFESRSASRKGRVSVVRRPGPGCFSFKHGAQSVDLEAMGKSKFSRSSWNEEDQQQYEGSFYASKDCSGYALVQVSEAKNMRDEIINLPKTAYSFDARKVAWTPEHEEKLDGIQPSEAWART
ncbi:MAG: hypothetical protein M1833_003380 [Piccolia ochrophora]|nr:MAG: hypothetical protein M1833_003380 [Piccolia ochrophora]